MWLHKKNRSKSLLINLLYKHIAFIQISIMEKYAIFSNCGSWVVFLSTARWRLKKVHAKTVNKNWIYVNNILQPSLLVFSKHSCKLVFGIVNLCRNQKTQTHRWMCLHPESYCFLFIKVSCHPSRDNPTCIYWLKKTRNQRLKWSKYGRSQATNRIKYICSKSFWKNFEHTHALTCKIQTICPLFWKQEMRQRLSATVQYLAWIIFMNKCLQKLV